MRWLLLLLVLVQFSASAKRRKNDNLLRKLPKKFHHETELQLQGELYDPDNGINPLGSWQQFMSHNEEMDHSSDLERDFGFGKSTKSTGSENFNTVEVIPGPRGPAGPPGVLVLDEFAQMLELLRDADGDIKKSKKGRYKAGGPVLNIVFGSGTRGNADSTTSVTQPGSEKLEGGFYSTLRTDVFLQRLSRLQLSNFLKPRAGPTSFLFNTGLDFDHRSGSLTSSQTAVYFITATINLQRIPADDNELPEFEDNVTARICMDEECLVWALETKIPVLHTKYASLTLQGMVRLENGKNAYLFVENNSGLNFKILRSAGLSAYVMGPGD